MRAMLRTKVAAAVVAILAGALLALFAATGPAVAFFSGGLFLDVQVESPATLVARGAVVDVPVELTCNAGGRASLFVTVTQKSGSGVAEGATLLEPFCTGSGQELLIRVEASGGKTFKQGIAVATAEVQGCNFRTCGRETDTETIDIQR
jgi:hypothetical protein